MQMFTSSDEKKHNVKSEFKNYSSNRLPLEKKKKSDIIYGKVHRSTCYELYFIYKVQLNIT